MARCMILTGVEWDDQVYDSYKYGTIIFSKAI